MYIVYNIVFTLTIIILSYLFIFINNILSKFDQKNVNHIINNLDGAAFLTSSQNVNEYISSSDSYTSESDEENYSIPEQEIYSELDIENKSDSVSSEITSIDTHSENNIDNDILFTNEKKETNFLIRSKYIFGKNKTLSSNYSLCNDEENLNKWKDNINTVLHELLSQNHGKLFKNCFKDIVNNKHYLYWKNTKQVDNLKKYTSIALDLGLVYNYDSNNYKNSDTEIFTNNLSRFCHHNEIILIIIGELYPENVKQLNINLFNSTNYISPYHYTKSFFSNPTKLPIGKYTKKRPNISINQILNDVINQYRLEKNKLLYIGCTQMNNFEEFNSH